MNKILKRILILLAALVAMFLLYFIYFSYQVSMQKAGMFVPQSKKISSQIYIINDSFVGMFLIRDNDSYIAIDAGNNPYAISNELKSLHVDSSSVKAVFLTHSDADHCNGLSVFPQAKVYLSRDEEQMINGKTQRVFFKHNSLNKSGYTLLNDNFIVQIGNISVKTIATPGHTPGSMSFVVNDSLLFVGDAFGLKKGRIIQPNDFFTKDMKTAIKSYKRIKNLKSVKYIFTSHYGFSTDYKFATDSVL